jgi:hypothetical protein
MKFRNQKSVFDRAGVQFIARLKDNFLLSSFTSEHFDEKDLIKAPPLRLLRAASQRGGISRLFFI